MSQKSSYEELVTLHTSCVPSVAGFLTSSIAETWKHETTTYDHSVKGFILTFKKNHVWKFWRFLPYTNISQNYDIRLLRLICHIKEFSLPVNSSCPVWFIYCCNCLRCTLEIISEGQEVLWGPIVGCFWNTWFSSVSSNLPEQTA